MVHREGAPPAEPGTWFRLKRLLRRTGSRLGPSAPARLDAAADVLEGLCGASEAEFMHLGERLAFISRRADAILKRAAEAADVLRGAEVATSLTQVQGVLGYVQTQLTEGNARIDQVRTTLAGVSAAMQQADGPLHTIGMAIQSLRMLTTTTRTESARLGRTEGGFEHLTVQVTQFGNAISTRLDGLRDELATHRAHLEQAARQMADHREAQSLDLDRVTARLRDSLMRLERKRAAQSEAVERLSAGSREVVRAVGDVVASLQYQDITRQQMEHVRDALREYARGYLRADRAGFCSLQAHQLVVARDDLTRALGGAHGGLRTVSERVAGLVADMDALGTDNGAGEDDRFERLLHRLRQGFEEATAALAAHAEMMAGVETRVRELTEALEGMVASSAGVENIGYEIRLIALNTAVKAAALGTRGAALDMVAHLVGELSERVMAQTNAFRGALGEIRRHAERLGELMQVAERPQRTRAAQHELQDALAGIEGLVGRTVDELAEMQQAGRLLADEVAVLLGRTETEALVRREVDGALDLLRVAGGAGSVSALLELGAREPGRGLAALVARYTTGRQRRTHAAWLGNESEVPAEARVAAPELWDEVSADGAHAPPALPESEPEVRSATGSGSVKAAEDDDLGDNVVLF